VSTVPFVDLGAQAPDLHGEYTWPSYSEASI